MKIAYFDMFSGVSGDMILGALVSCGVPEELLRETVAALGLPEVEITARRSESHGIASVKVEVQAGSPGHHHHHHHEEHHHRGLSEIRRMIGESSLGPEVKELATAIFTRLGEAEAAVHGVELEKVHFHEVGAVDSIVDIVGAAAGLVSLNIGRYYAGAFRVGTGFIEFSHGRLALPAPATLKLIEGCPMERTGVPSELTTPTGAAIVSTLVKKEDYEPAKALTFNSTGYGQGSRVLNDRPNLLRLMIGEEGREPGQCPGTLVLECNIDDMNPEFYDYVLDRLFAAGARDVFLSAIQMKKNRPGTLLSIIAEPSLREKLSGIIFRETSTIGIRYYPVNRMILKRASKKVKTRFGTVKVKIIEEPDGTKRATPEYEDLKRIAETKKIPLKVFYDEVLRSIKEKTLKY